MYNKPFKDRIVLVTGSTRGIGWQTAQKFAEEGAHVIINGLNDSKLLEERAKDLENRYNIQSMALHADFSNPESIQNAYKLIFQRFKRLDILVNNAGIMHTGLLGMLDENSISSSFAINSIGTILSMQSASRLMQKAGQGSIVNVSSIIGRYGHEGQVVYGSTKAAVIGATLSAAKELARYKIRVNCVAPGMISTDLLNELPEEKKREAIQDIKLGRLGTPEDVAEAIVFLSSDKASYITGQILGVDGGMVV